MELQARILREECRFEEAGSEALRADVFENFGAAKDLERCRDIIRDINERESATSSESDFKSERLNFRVDFVPLFIHRARCYAPGHPSK